MAGMLWLRQARWPRLEDEDDPLHDGDSIKLEVDQGEDEHKIMPLRLKDVYAPELSKPGGEEIRAIAAYWCQIHWRPGWPFIVQTIKNRNVRTVMSLGRYMSIVWSDLSMTDSLNAHMIKAVAAHPEWGRGTGG
jgi:hypothetical protein